MDLRVLLARPLVSGRRTVDRLEVRPDGRSDIAMTSCWWPRPMNGAAPAPAPTVQFRLRSRQRPLNGVHFTDDILSWERTRKRIVREAVPVAIYIVRNNVPKDRLSMLTRNRVQPTAEGAKAADVIGNPTPH